MDALPALGWGAGLLERGPTYTLFGLVLRGVTAGTEGGGALEVPRETGFKGAFGTSGAGDAGPIETGARLVGSGIGPEASERSPVFIPKPYPVWRGYLGSGACGAAAGCVAGELPGIFCCGDAKAGGAAPDCGALGCPADQS